jgi:hypothetical protein
MTEVFTKQLEDLLQQRNPVRLQILLKSNIQYVLVNDNINILNIIIKNMVNIRGVLEDNPNYKFLSNENILYSFHKKEEFIDKILEIWFLSRTINTLIPTYNNYIDVALFMNNAIIVKKIINTITRILQANGQVLVLNRNVTIHALITKDPFIINEIIKVPNIDFHRVQLYLLADLCNKDAPNEFLKNVLHYLEPHRDNERINNYVIRIKELLMAREIAVRSVSTEPINVSQAKIPRIDGTRYIPEYSSKEIVHQKHIDKIHKTKDEPSEIMNRYLVKYKEYINLK